MASIISVQNLNIYADGQQLLSLPALELEEGEFLALTGPSGAGKSTVLKYLAQLQNPDLTVEGSYRYRGQPIEDWDPVALRKEVSYCTQTPSLFGDRVRDNLAFPAEIRGQVPDFGKIVRMLEGVGLSEADLDKAVDDLSGGEKQRVALVRNLIYQPRVLLLDEITSALDADNRRLIWQGIHAMLAGQGVSVIMVSHDQAEWQEADRILEMGESGAAGAVGDQPSDSAADPAAAGNRPLAEKEEDHE